MDRRICAKCKLVTQANENELFFGQECACGLPKKVLEDCKKRVKRGEIFKININNELVEPTYDVVSQPKPAQNVGLKTPIKRQAPNLPTTFPKTPFHSSTITTTAGDVMTMAGVTNAGLHTPNLTVNNPEAPSHSDNEVSWGNGPTNRMQNDPTLLPLATGGDEQTAELHQHPMQTRSRTDVPDLQSLSLADNQAKQQSDQADSEFTIGILRRALEASTKELEESRIQLNQQAALNEHLSDPNNLPEVTKFERNLMISRQNLLDATKAIEEDDKMEMILVRDHLSQAIHKLEIDLQTVLAILGDLEHVSIEWTLSFREDGKKNIKEFKHTFQLLEDKITRLESASMQLTQTPPMRQVAAPLPTVGRCKCRS